MSLFSKYRTHGFTLIELLVSLGIMAVIITVIIFNQSTYTESAALTQWADQIAATVSEARAYGVAVKEFTPGSANFSSSYGFSVSFINPSDNASYIFFADRDNDHVYDNTWACPTDSSSECVEKTAITNGNYVDAICTITTATENCNTAQRVDITFTRPNLTAQLAFFNNGGQNYNPANLIGARIKLRSRTGLMRSVVVYSSGQVSVQ